LGWGWGWDWEDGGFVFFSFSPFGTAVMQCNAMGSIGMRWLSYVGFDMICAVSMDWICWIEFVLRIPSDRNEDIVF
jgi:hypothetical protein